MPGDVEQLIIIHVFKDIMVSDDNYTICILNCIIEVRKRILKVFY